MIWIIGYIIGMILTLFCGLWYLSVKRYELYCKDIGELLFVTLLFPIAVPVYFIIYLPDLLYTPANFIFKKMKKWRKRQNDRDRKNA